MTLLFLSSSSSSLQRDTFTKKEGLFICSYPDTDRYCRYTGNDAETHINAHIHTSRLQRKRLTGLGFFFSVQARVSVCELEAIPRWYLN